MALQANRSSKRPAGDRADEVIPRKRCKASNKAGGPKSSPVPLVVPSSNSVPPDLSQPLLDDPSSTRLSEDQHNPQQDSTKSSSQKRMKGNYYERH